MKPKTRTSKPDTQAQLLDLARQAAAMLAQQSTERETTRLSVFNRAWELASQDQRVALALAFLGGEK
jgi:hypothetical protein